jgi:hypothetical protein
MVGRKRPLAAMGRCAAATVVAGPLLTGCGPAGAAPQSVANEFVQALADGQPGDACDLLAPQTRSELEQSTRTPCAQALAGKDIPAAGAPVATERFGNQAQVRFDADTIFLAEFSDGWRVVAAGCKSREPLPYDCVLKGA